MFIITNHHCRLNCLSLFSLDGFIQYLFTSNMVRTLQQETTGVQTNRAKRLVHRKIAGRELCPTATARDRTPSLDPPNRRRIDKSKNHGRSARQTSTLRDMLIHVQKTVREPVKPRLVEVIDYPMESRREPPFRD